MIPTHTITDFNKWAFAVFYFAEGDRLLLYLDGKRIPIIAASFNLKVEKDLELFAKKIGVVDANAKESVFADTVDKLKIVEAIQYQGSKSRLDNKVN